MRCTIPTGGGSATPALLALRRRIGDSARAARVSAWTAPCSSNRGPVATPCHTLVSPPPSPGNGGRQAGPSVADRAARNGEEGMGQRNGVAAGRAGLEDTLWKAADKLRGSMDAAEYKHFVLGLVFLKYVSDAFTERREEIERELDKEGISADRAARFLEDRDEYVGRGVFWVPRAARWELIARGAKSGAGGKSVGELINAAMEAIEGQNPGRPRDVLGHVYEYCLERFAAAEGKRGGEFYTPQSVVRLLVEVLEPKPGSRVYDPCCGSGGMFVQAERFIETHGGQPFDIAVYG